MIWWFFVFFLNVKVDRCSNIPVQKNLKMGSFFWNIKSQSSKMLHGRLPHVSLRWGWSWEPSCQGSERTKCRSADDERRGRAHRNHDAHLFNHTSTALSTHTSTHACGVLTELEAQEWVSIISFIGDLPQFHTWCRFMNLNERDD